MNKWRNPALQTSTNHYKPLQTYESVGAEECAQGESARRPGGTKHLHPLRGRCDAAATRATFQDFFKIFKILSTFRTLRVCRVCVTPQLLGYVEDGGRYDAKPNVHAMCCTTSLDIPHYTDVHRCCMLLHATQSYLCLEPRPLLGPSTVWLRSQQSNFNTGILEGSRLINERGQPFASIMSQTGTRSVPIDINWYLRTPFSKFEMVETCMVSTFIELDRNPEVMHFHAFRWVEHEKLQDMSNEDSIART